MVRQRRISAVARRPTALLPTGSKLEITAMARLEPDQVRDPERIFIAKSLRLALRVEEWLTTAGVDYTVQTESVGRSLLFGTDRMGAVFYVNSGQAGYCREHLAAAGLGSGVVDSQVDSEEEEPPS
jgi:hypothetical protein